MMMMMMIIIIIILNSFAWNIRGAYDNVSVMLRLLQPHVALMHYKMTSACYIAGPTTNATIT